MLIRQGNITIRDFLQRDIENKIRWINDPENNLFLHYELPLEYEKTLKWFQTKNDDGRCDCVIEYEDKPVGVIGLLNIDPVSMKAEFYICIGEKDYKGKGIAKSATRMLLNYGFNELGLNKIYLNADSENIVACRLYESLHFVCEGEFKQDMMHRGRLIDRKRYAAFRK